MLLIKSWLPFVPVVIKHALMTVNIGDRAHVHQHALNAEEELESMAVR